ncbi:DNA gyrase subunit A [Agrilactobacillus composti DSM 18527 = JCM 14202]|nr:DNA gyrase subunit A [Agrilactobacillus composti DSM 18527 = JCM 14202]
MNREHYLFFITRLGVVKRTLVGEFDNIRKSGLRAVTLRDEDELSNVLLTDGTANILIGTHLGYAVSFRETDIRAMGRTAAGVRGIRLRDKDYVVGSDVLTPDKDVFVISEKGYGKRTPAKEYPIKGRGGKGIKTANITSKNGPLAGVTTVKGNEDILLMTNTGVLIRFEAENISTTGRATLGVRLIRVDDDALVSTMAKVDPEAEKKEEAEAAAKTAADTTAEAGPVDLDQDHPEVDELLNRAQADDESTDDQTDDDNQDDPNDSDSE